MVRDFQTVVGREAKKQFMEMTGGLPDALVACVGGGSNAIGLFSAFLEDKGVAMYGVEPAGLSFKDGEHAATLTAGRPADITVIDPKAKWKVDSSLFYSKARNTPFEGMDLKGFARYTILGGAIVYMRK